MYHIQNIHPNGILSHFLSSGIFLLCNCFSSLTAQTSSSSASPPLSLSLCFVHFILVIPHSYISPLLVHLVVSDHTQTTERQMKPAKQRPTKHDREKYNTWRWRRKHHHLWETLCVFVCVCVYVLGGEAGGTWEITHYFIVLVFGGKALLKLSLLPFHLSSSLTNSLLPFPSLHHFRPHLFLPSHFPFAIFSFLLPLLPSLSSSQPVSGVFSHNFSPLYFFILSASPRLLGKAGAGSSLALRQWNTSKSKSSTNLTNFSHTHKQSRTNRTFQLPAAPDSSPWLIWNGEWDWEWSRAGKQGENCGWGRATPNRGHKKKPIQSGGEKLRTLGVKESVI